MSICPFAATASRWSGAIHTAIVDFATLPPFTNNRAYPDEGPYPIRVLFNRGCRMAVGGDHFHRMCPNGHEWLEQINANYLTRTSTWRVAPT